MPTLPDPADLAADIPITAARAAHRGTSHVPEKRGDQEVAGYVATLTADFAGLAKLATTDEKRAILAVEFERYRAGHRERTLSHLAAKSQVVSTMIAGPSGFNVRRAAKRNATEDRRRDDLLTHRVRALESIRRKLTPESAPIMAGDRDAVARLRADLAKRQATQDAMKAVNATIRKHAKAGPDAQVAALLALGFKSITEARARELLKPDFCGRIGFADFEMVNNGARIRDITKRIAALEVAKATPDAEPVEGAAARLEESAADNRVRLFFPGKPDLATRTRLKGAGFRWTPSIEAWQAYINDRSRAVARQIAGVES